jgi:hypothetical protein
MRLEALEVRWEAGARLSSRDDAYQCQEMLVSSEVVLVVYAA